MFLAALGLMAAMGGSHFLRGAGSTASGLVILTPHGDNIRQEIGAAFQAWHQARYGETPELTWVDQGGTSEDLRYVQARYAKTPDGIGIDLFFGGGTPPFRSLAKAGFLEPRSVDPEALAGIPEFLGGSRVYAAEEGWYGAALSGFGILFNRALLKDKGLAEPASWADLADPKAWGWVAMVDPRGSGSAHVIYEIVLQRYGWDKGWRILAGIAANASHFTKGASAVLPLISAGEAAYTVAIDQYAWSLIEKLGGDRVGFLLPPGETVNTADPIAILKGAPHRELARRFATFVLSVPCQRLWALKAGVPGGPKAQSLNRMSVRPAVAAGLDTAYSFVRGDPFAEAAAQLWTYSDSLTEARWSIVNDALGLWMVDNHNAASAAYADLARAHPPETDRAGWESALAAHPLFSPPAAWEAMRAMAGRWKEDAFRNATLADWAKRLAESERIRHD
jgi:ABC-type Fe3+ transport system substrate-binding protein